VAIKLFGFTLGSKDVVQKEKPEQQSFVLPSAAQLDDGAVTITQNAYYGTYVDLEGSVRNEIELITRYREMSNHPECQMAIDEIVNEAITHDDRGKVVDVVLDNLKQPESIKKKIIEEFDNIQKMLNFNNLADDLFKRWYIDGRMFYHVVVNDKNPKEGIQELRYIDPRKIRKVREVKKERDPKTGALVVDSVAEYYVFNDRGTTTQTFTANVTQGLRIAPESIININSGLMDAKNTFVISYLHKAIKPLNQLRMIEDAIVIYRISRAPERRIFYIDVGNLPKGKAEQYLRDIMIKYRNKMVYDANTGELRDERKHMSMLEDFWLPRREGGKGTEITTLPAGQNLGELEDVKYFQKKLLQSLNVPYSRLESQEGGMAGLGRSQEVTRDELKFAKFVVRLRNKFSQIFDEALKIQLVLKGICTREEWDQFKEDIYYDFRKDNNFTELREAELLQNRLQMVGMVDPFVGRYFSNQYVMNKILMMTDEEIEEMQEKIKEEKDTLPPEMQGPMAMQQAQAEQEQQAAEAAQTPPQDNTIDSEDQTESLTPQLDNEVNKSVVSINNRRR
jgi:Bacteriophage T4-like portal protein (Gp20)